MSIVIMATDFVLCLPLRPLSRKREITLTTGEVVTVENVLKTTCIVNGRYVGADDELFYSQLKPGDVYRTEVSYVFISFNFTQVQLLDKRGPSYYKHLEELGLVKIGPPLKVKC